MRWRIRQENHWVSWVAQSEEGGDGPAESGTRAWRLAGPGAGHDQAIATELSDPGLGAPGVQC